MLSEIKDLKLKNVTIKCLNKSKTLKNKKYKLPSYLDFINTKFIFFYILYIIFSYSLSLIIYYWYKNV